MPTSSPEPRPRPAVSDIPAPVLELKASISARYLNKDRARVIAHRPNRLMSAAVAAAPFNVHSVGVGRRTIDGRQTGEVVLRLYVVQKLPNAALSPEARIPRDFDGVETEVIEAPPAFIAQFDPKQQHRPILGGISLAHHKVTAGTLGYFAHSTRPGDDPEALHVLSNNHILANVNGAAIGEPILQQSRLDGGSLASRVASYLRTSTIKLGGTETNTIDAAIASIDPGIQADIMIERIGRISTTARAVEDMKVRKYGRTSEYTEGFVDDEAFDALVGMDHNDPSVVAKFVDQFRIKPSDPYPYIGLGGDSGSLVVQRDEPAAVGLFFAAPPDGSYGVANHISNVLNDLEIRLA
jgi:hypothetical protein